MNLCSLAFHTRQRHIGCRKTFQSESFYKWNETIWRRIAAKKQKLALTYAMAGRHIVLKSKQPSQDINQDIRLRIKSLYVLQIGIYSPDWNLHFILHRLTFSAMKLVRNMGINSYTNSLTVVFLNIMKKKSLNSLLNYIEFLVLPFSLFLLFILIK